MASGRSTDPTPNKHVYLLDLGGMPGAVRISLPGDAGGATDPGPRATPTLPPRPQGQPKIQPFQFEPRGISADAQPDSILPASLGGESGHRHVVSMHDLAEERRPVELRACPGDDGLRNPAHLRLVASAMEFLMRLGFAHEPGEPLGLNKRSMLALLDMATSGIRDYASALPLVLDLDDDRCSNLCRTVMCSGGREIKYLLLNQELICGSARSAAAADTQWSSFIWHRERRHLYVYDSGPDLPGSWTRSQRATFIAQSWALLHQMLGLPRDLECFLVPLTCQAGASHSGYIAAYMVLDRLRSWQGLDYSAVGEVAPWSWFEPDSGRPSVPELLLLHRDWVRMPGPDTPGLAISKVVSVLGAMAMCEVGMTRARRLTTGGREEYVRGLRHITVPQAWDSRYRANRRVTGTGTAWAAFHTNRGGFQLLVFKGEESTLQEDFRPDRPQIRQMPAVPRGPRQSVVNGGSGGDDAGGGPSPDDFRLGSLLSYS